MGSVLAPAIAAAIDRGAILLTPNQRAARAIRQAFDGTMQAAGQTVWAPAQALPLDTWFAGLWHQRILAGAEDRVLLNSTQQHVLWREIIAADRESGEAFLLRSHDALAEMAARAWTLACLFKAHPRLREFAGSTDSRAFERWSRAFERRLARAKLITPAQLPAELSVASGLIQNPIALVDFDDHPPTISALFAALEQSGVAIEVIRTDLTPTHSGIFTAADDQQELLAAATWTRRQRDLDSDAKIAIIVPSLAERRAEIARTFGPILNPASLPITAPESSPTFEFSLGRSLAELPITIAALDLLAWPLHPLPLESISALLLSPWFGSIDPATAEFDAFELRQSTMLRPELTLKAAIRLVEHSRRAKALGSPLLRLRSLNKAAQSAYRSDQSQTHTQSFTQWADTFRNVLDAAGWTSHARTHSLAFQQHRRFEGALDELATLDFDSSRPNAAEALAALTRILRQTVFAPESEDAPVQIIGPLEVGAVQFDALWFLGVDDLAWPSPLTPNPLLSWQIGRAFGIPGSDRARDIARAQALTTRIARSAREVVFSFAAHSQEGERRPSPLLASLNLSPLPVLEAAVPPQALPYERIHDDTMLPRLPEGLIKGGAQILKLQAACPFRAFAEKRLWSKPLDTRDTGFDAIERGTIVHSVMQTFWTGLKTQAALRSLTLEQRGTLLTRAIDSALHDASGQSETAWDTAYLAIQRRRLHNLLSPWLDRELNRPHFDVQTPEQGRDFALGPLTLRLRIDRIDSTAAGLVILDYKTGSVTPASWEGSRPDDPQLPLYALLASTLEEPLAGVAFALLRAGEGLALKGYADDPAAFGKSTKMEAASLAEQVDEWRLVLSRLAAAYAAGDTRVAPKSYPKTCEHCGQRILCRLDPATLPDFDDEDSQLEGDASFA